MTRRIALVGTGAALVAGALAYAALTFIFDRVDDLHRELGGAR